MAEPGSEGAVPKRWVAPHVNSQESKKWPQVQPQEKIFLSAKYSDPNWMIANAQGASSRGLHKSSRGPLITTGGSHSSLKSLLKIDL